MSGKRQTVISYFCTRFATKVISVLSSRLFCNYFFPKFSSPKFLNLKNWKFNKSANSSSNRNFSRISWFPLNKKQVQKRQFSAISRKIILKGRFPFLEIIRDFNPPTGYPFHQTIRHILEGLLFQLTSTSKFMLIFWDFSKNLKIFLFQIKILRVPALYF